VKLTCSPGNLRERWCPASLAVASHTAYALSVGRRCHIDPKGEVLAKGGFRTLLVSVGIFDARWRRGRDPPDYYLRVNGKSFAVEVTRAMQATEVGMVRLPEHGWRAALSQFVKDIQNKAEREGILSGTYGMQLAPIPDLRRRRPELLASALRYIARTTFADTAPPEKLASVPHGHSITIEKVGAARDYVGAVIMIGTAKRSVQIERDLTRILTERLREKTRRLSRVRLPRILLLVDSYIYGERDHWQAVAEQLDLAAFHTVARIPDFNRCQVLRTEEPRWNTAV